MIWLLLLLLLLLLLDNDADSDDNDAEFYCDPILTIVLELEAKFINFGGAAVFFALPKRCEITDFLAIRPCIFILYY